MDKKEIKNISCYMLLQFFLALGTGIELYKLLPNVWVEGVGIFILACGFYSYIFGYEIS